MIRALESGDALSMSSVVRTAHIHRPAAYRAVRALHARGILESHKNGKRTTFRSKGTETLVSLFAETTSTVAQTARSAQKADPTFAHVRYLTGTKGITEIFADVLQHTKKGDTFFRYTSERNLDEVNSYLPKDYRTMRDRKKIERQVISNVHSGSRKRPRLERFVKFLGGDKEHFTQNAIQLIYGTRIAFIDITRKECFVIENETLAEFQKVIFKALYRRL